MKREFIENNLVYSFQIHTNTARIADISEFQDESAEEMTRRPTKK